MHIVSVSIPSLKEEWYFSPLTTAQQILVCKAILESQENYILFNKITNKILLENVSDEFKQKITNITIFDKIIIFLKLRCASVGNIVELQIQKDEKNFNFEYDFANTLIEAIKKYQEFTFTDITHNNISITCNIPSIHHEQLLLNTAMNVDALFSDIVPFFVSKITINDSVINLNAINIKDREKILDSIPIKAYQELIAYLNRMLQFFSSFKLYKISNESLSLNFLGSSCVEFLKFVLNFNLYNIYQEVFALTKYANMSAQYTETLTALERELYISLLKAANKQSGEEASEASSMQIPSNDSNVFNELDLYHQLKGG